MNKILNKIKEKDQYFILLYSFLCVLGISFNIYIANSDELWNFFNIYKMSNGYLIYEELNVIITPIFFYIGSFLLNFLGQNIFVFRIYNCIILIFLFFFLYKIMREIGLSRFISFLVINFFMVTGNFLVIRGGANYNTLALTISFIGICILLQDKFHKKMFLIQGIIGALVFLTKQNIGIFYSIGYCIYILCSKDKKIKEILKYILVFMCINICFCLILYFQGNLFDFINYCFLGLNEFANNNVTVDFIYFSCLVTVLLLTIFFIILNKKIDNKFDNEKKRNLKILICFSIPFLLIAYPIANRLHCIISGYLLFILFIYVIFQIVLGGINKIKIKNKQIIESILLVIVGTVLISLSFANLINWFRFVFSEEKYYNYEDPFFGGIISEEMYNNIQNVSKYIEETENEVIIMSPKAAFYMINFNINHKDFDLPLKGNFGKEGEKGLIKQIKKLENVNVLIEKDEEKLNWQESLILRNYIMENMNCVGEIEEFLIYEKKS